MHVVIRHYEGSSKLIDELVGRRKDVEELGDTSGQGAE